MDTRCKVEGVGLLSLSTEFDCQSHVVSGALVGSGTGSGVKVSGCASKVASAGV